MFWDQKSNFVGWIHHSGVKLRSMEPQRTERMPIVISGKRQYMRKLLRQFLPLSRRLITHNFVLLVDRGALNRSSCRFFSAFAIRVRPNRRWYRCWRKGYLRVNRFLKLLFMFTVLMAFGLVSVSIAFRFFRSSLQKLCVAVLVSKTRNKMEPHVPASLENMLLTITLESRPDCSAIFAELKSDLAIPACADPRQYSRFYQIGSLWHVQVLWKCIFESPSLMTVGQFLKHFKSSSLVVRLPFIN